MKLINLIRRAPKQLYAAIAVAAAVVTVPAVLLAWGPDRPTYTIDNPADHVTFNSITNNPNIGDERNFVGIREKGTNDLWSDNMTVQPGKEYTVRVYVHNNAATSLNASGAGIAHDTTARVNLPTTTGKSIQVDGQISASNASPKDVWDQAVFNSTQDFNLAYVAGSLKYENNAFGAAGAALPESIFTQTGAKLGYDSLNGEMPGCFQYAGYISFTVKPQFTPTADFTMSKTVSKHGANTWVESYAAQPGETVDYLVKYKNTSAVQQDNVTVKDVLPTGMTYVAGSTKFGTVQNPGGVQASDNITTTGINIGSYGQNGATWVMLSAKVPTVDQMPCGPQTLVNKASVTTDYGTKDDTATVTVPGKDCPQPKPIQVCELSTKKVITIDEKDFDSTKHSKNLEDCKQPETPGKVKVCNPTTGEIITVDEKDKGNYAPIDSDKCKDTKVCRVADKKIVTIKNAAYDASKYTTDMTKCQSAELPAELPQTGAADAVAKLAGAVSLASATAYYVASRRQN